MNNLILHQATESVRFLEKSNDSNYSQASNSSLRWINVSDITIKWQYKFSNNTFDIPPTRCKQFKNLPQYCKHSHPFNIIASGVSPALRRDIYSTDLCVDSFSRCVGLPDDAIVKSSFVSRIGLRNSALGVYVRLCQPCASASRAMRHDQGRI